MTSNFDYDYLIRFFKNTGFEITDWSKKHFIICNYPQCKLAQVHRTSANNYEVDIACPVGFESLTYKSFTESIKAIKEIYGI